MSAKEEVVVYMYQMCVIRRVLVSQSVQDVDFDQALFFKARLVPYYFDCNLDATLVIEAASNLPG